MNDTRRAILDALSADAPVSGPALADRIGVSRAAVWKQIEALREAGFDVESKTDGYALAGVPAFGGDAVEYGQDAFAVEYHDSIGSTNDRARELAAAGASDVVVLADEQTGGRGRLKRAWSGPSGGIWTSLLIRPDLPPAQAPILTLAAAVAVTKAARAVGVDAVIKWPNDVLVSGANEGTSEPAEEVLVSGANEGTSEPSCESTSESSEESTSEPSGGKTETSGRSRGGEKLAGILTEMEGEANRVSWVIVGIGINANVEAGALPEGATSLQERVGPVNRREFVQTLLEVFDELRTDPESVLDEWRGLADTLGRRVRVETASGVVVGEAVDVAFPGTLVVETAEGRVTVSSGDCEHLRPI